MNKKNLLTKRVFISFIVFTLFTFNIKAQNNQAKKNNLIDLVINVDVCTTTADTVRITGPFWNWSPNGGPLGTNNGNGTWSFTLSPAPTVDMEYLVIVDGVYESLISDMQNGGTCAPVTDYFSYANRKWVVGSGDVNISYDRCVPCSYPNIVITTCAPGATSVKLTGPNWQWNPNFGPSAVNNGNGTWTFSISPAPNDTLEYKLIKDGVFEDLIPAMVNGGTCAPVTDYANYANRRWLISDGAISNTFGSCASCNVTGIFENFDKSIQVYPNPANSNVKIKYSNKSFKTKVLNILGELVTESSSDNFEDELNLTNLANGVYYLTVSSNIGTTSIKLIKE